jgi:hypothetical protein
MMTRRQRTMSRWHGVFATLLFSLFWRLDDKEGEESYLSLYHFPF